MTGHTEKKSTPYPLPAGEGQPDTPINQHKQGEILTPRIEKTVFISHRNSNEERLKSSRSFYLSIACFY